MQMTCFSGEDGITCFSSSKWKPKYEIKATIMSFNARGTNALNVLNIFIMRMGTFWRKIKNI